MKSKVAENKMNAFVKDMILDLEPCTNLRKVTTFGFFDP